MTEEEIYKVFLECRERAHCFMVQLWICWSDRSMLDACVNWDPKDAGEELLN